MKGKFNVYGMTCSACSSAVERSVKKLNGIKTVSVNLTANTLFVDYEEKLLAEKDIIGAVVKAGYKASVFDGEKHDEKNKLGFRVILSLPFAISIFYIAMGAMWGLPQPAFLKGGQNALTLAFVQAVLFLPVAVINYKYFTSGFKKLFTFHPNMDSLIATGALACIVYSVVTTVQIFNAHQNGHFEHCAHLTHSLQYEGASMILTLVTVGKFFEAKSKLKTGDALKKLKEITPYESIILQNGVEKRVAVATLEIGDILVVKEGMVIACDGEVVNGEGAINQSAITGESVPVYKNAGQTVFGGTILQSGYLQIKITATSENSSIAKIINMVEEAGASKAPISSLADKIALVFVPVVIGISLVTFLIHYLISKDFSLAFNYGVSVLVVSCPCALGLATPLAVILGSGKGAQHGVLIRSGEALQKLASVSVICFDKTGTLTEGSPTVVQTEFLNNQNQKTKLLEIFYALESKSSHPLAKAICDYCEKKNITLKQSEKVENLHGRGVKGVIDGEKYLIANFATVSQIVSNRESEIYKNLALQGITPVFLANQTQILAILGIQDKIRTGAVEAISAMRENGLKAVMITGDNDLTASAVAKNLGVEYLANVLPAEKLSAVKKLKEQGKVAFVGDGINDAPALAESDVGMAIGTGTDVAIENADVILLKNDVRDAIYAVMLGKRCIRTIKQNLFWAFLYNCICIPLASGAFSGLLGLSLTPAIASVMMSLSSLFVVGNSLKLRYFDKIKGLETYDKTQNQNLVIVKNNTVNGETEVGNCDCPLNDFTVKENKTSCENLQNENSFGEQNNKNNQKTEGEKMKKYIYLNGMMCMHCKARVEKILGKCAGIVSAQVELENHRALIEYTTEFDMQLAINALSEDGYDFVREENV